MSMQLTFPEARIRVLAPSAIERGPGEHFAPLAIPDTEKHGAFLAARAWAVDELSRYLYPFWSGFLAGVLREHVEVYGPHGPVRGTDAEPEWLQILADSLEAGFTKEMSDAIGGRMLTRILNRGLPVCERDVEEIANECVAAQILGEGRAEEDLPAFLLRAGVTCGDVEKLWIGRAEMGFTGRETVEDGFEEFEDFGDAGGVDPVEETAVAEGGDDEYSDAAIQALLAEDMARVAAERDAALTEAGVAIPEPKKAARKGRKPKSEGEVPGQPAVAVKVLAAMKALKALSVADADIAQAFTDAGAQTSRSAINHILNGRDVLRGSAQEFEAVLGIANEIEFRIGGILRGLHAPADECPEEIEEPEGIEEPEAPLEGGDAPEVFEEGFDEGFDDEDTV
jgi:hypothetical protein